MKDTVNGQSSEANENNVGLPQGSLFPNLFLLYTNNLPTNILRSLLNIYAGDSTVY